MRGVENLAKHAPSPQSSPPAGGEEVFYLIQKLPVLNLPLQNHIVALLQ